MENKRYKAPFDMYGGMIEKGDVYFKMDEIDKCYYAERYTYDDYTCLPEEIVEKYFEEVKEELEVEFSYALNYIAKNSTIESIGFDTEEERMNFIKQNPGEYELKTIVISK
jgi:hypothetical protein